MNLLKKILPTLHTDRSVTAIGRTETGPVREKNEDGFGIWRGSEDQGEGDSVPMEPLQRVDTKMPVLVMVADGMGGHGEGQATSQMALRVVAEQLLANSCKSFSSMELPSCSDRRGAPEGRGGFLGQNIFAPLNKEKTDLNAGTFSSSWAHVSKEAVDQAWLAIRAKFEPENLMTGTTLSGLLFFEDHVGLVHLGDSVIYRWRKGKLETVSECQSYVGRLLREGKISAEQARIHPKRNIVEMALTSDPNLDPKAQITVVRSKPGDRWILATDGLTDGLTDERITDLLKKTNEQPAADALNRLIDQSLEYSGRDNTTAIVVDVGTNLT